MASECGWVRVRRLATRWAEHVTRHGIIRKWRPPLALVLGGTLLSVLVLPILGLFVLRYAAPVMGWMAAVVTISLVALIVTVILGWLLARLILRPSASLVSWADAIRHSPAVPVAGPERLGTREFGDMAESLLRMGDELQWRVADLSSYSAHVTHELRSPLTSIRAAAELLNDDIDAAQRAELVKTIAEASSRMENLLVAMRAVAQADTAEARECDPQPVAETAHAVAQRLGLTLECEGAPKAPLPSPQLELVLDHLLLNARDHGAKTVCITATEHGFSVADDGRGVSQKNAEKMFDPFFTTRRDSGGMGLGLFLIQRIVQSRGGSVTFSGNQPGATFDLCFQRPANNLT